MKMLIKDQRGYPSFTETATAITFAMLILCMLMILFRHIPVYYIGWFGGAWIAAMVFRYKKKVRLSREGIDISQDVQEKV